MQSTKTINVYPKVKSILLVDDDSDDHTFFNMALEKVDANIECHTALN
jgi:hypothetical protein